MNIAVVDEQALSLAGFSQILRRLPGVEAICFEKARDALHWVAGVSPICMVVSATLPEIDGIDLIRRLHLLPDRSETPVIFTTGKIDRDLRRKAFELGVYAYLEKPINPAEFLTYATNIVAVYNERIEFRQRLAQADQRASVARGDGNISEGDDLQTIATMQAVAAMHDPTIVAHLQLAAELATALATELQLTSEEIATIGTAARIYDIGKTSIPGRILDSRVPILGSDRITVELHVQAGAKLLATRDTPVMRAAASIAQAHHERYDGDGYPAKIRGTEIPIFGRIVAVADTIAALTRARADREALPLAQALDHVEAQSGLAFDPTVVAALRSGVADVSRRVRGAVAVKV